MTPHKETEVRIGVARAYVAAAVRIRTKDGFPVLKRCRKEDIDDIPAPVLDKLRRIGFREPWAVTAKTLLEDDDIARDVLYAMCSAPGAACVQAGAEALIRHGLDKDWAWEAANLLESKNRHLREALDELDCLGPSGAAVGPWHATSEFDRAIALCARASDRITLARDDDIPKVSQNEWNMIVRQAQDIPQLAEEAAKLRCQKVFQMLTSAGFEYRQNPSSTITWGSLDNHLKRFAIRVWWTHGVVPPGGRYREHLCRLVSFAARQTYLAEDHECHAAAEFVGRLVAGLEVMADRNRLTPVCELEPETVRAAAHRVSLICSYLENRGGCPAIIRELCGYEPVERTQLLGWQDDIDAAARGVTWHNGLETEPATSEPSTECAGGASTECADARAEEPQAVHRSGKSASRSFGSLFDE
jgi:hypothetical protein